MFKRGKHFGALFYTGLPLFYFLHELPIDISRSTGVWGFDIGEIYHK